ncbi:protein of unknown function [bacterium A37T11]|nr:protein of unknown function [bacterium A37T11]
MNRCLKIYKRYLPAVVFAYFFICAVTARAQDVALKDSVGKTTGPFLLPTTLINGERLPWILLPEVEVRAIRRFKTPEDRSKYFRLRYNVLKVMPYAKFAQQRYEQLHRDLAVTSEKKEQKRLVKRCEGEIKDMFNREIKNMSINQGEILIKLLDRQTGSSGYELVRELKGGFTAFVYQGVARVFGHNLKTKYDPEQDVEIENIVRSVSDQYGYHYF